MKNEDNSAEELKSEKAVTNENKSTYNNLIEKKSTEKKSAGKFNPRINKQQNYVYLSFVVPLFNEEESLEILAEKLAKEATEITKNNWEVWFIDDGSTDNSYEIIKQIHQKDNRFKCIRFRRNFGKSTALSVGFAYAKGKFVGTLDADLQDDPKEFKQMLSLLLNEGYDLVSGWKKKRFDPITKTIPSKFFNFVTSFTSGIKLHDFNCGIKLYRKEVVDSLEVYGEMHRFLPALAFWNGFKVTETPVEHKARKFGKSKFGFSRFIRGYLDLLTVVFTTRYLKRPMHFFGLLGTICFLVGAIIFGFLSIEWLLGFIALAERPLSWFSLGLTVIGIQLFSVGLIAELVVKQSHEKVKNFQIKSRLM
jgi:glycosyltransferase involved in cell wall biosynthesis